MKDQACDACNGSGQTGFWGDKAWMAVAVIGESAGMCIRCNATGVEPENEAQFLQNVELMRQFRLAERQARAA